MGPPQSGQTASRRDSFAEEAELSKSSSCHFTVRNRQLHPDRVPPELAGDEERRSTARETVEDHRGDRFAAALAGGAPADGLRRRALPPMPYTLGPEASSLVDGPGLSSVGLTVERARSFNLPHPRRPAFRTHAMLRRPGQDHPPHKLPRERREVLHHRLSAVLARCPALPVGIADAADGEGIGLGGDGPDGAGVLASGMCHPWDVTVTRPFLPLTLFSL